ARRDLFEQLPPAKRITSCGKDASRHPRGVRIGQPSVQKLFDDVPSFIRLLAVHQQQRTLGGVGGSRLIAQRGEILNCQFVLAEPYPHLCSAPQARWADLGERSPS